MRRTAAGIGERAACRARAQHAGGRGRYDLCSNSRAADATAAGHRLGPGMLRVAHPVDPAGGRGPGGSAAGTYARLAALARAGVRFRRLCFAGARLVGESWRIARGHAAVYRGG